MWSWRSPRKIKFFRNDFPSDKRPTITQDKQVNAYKLNLDEGFAWRALETLDNNREQKTIVNHIFYMLLLTWYNIPDKTKNADDILYHIKSFVNKVSTMQTKLGSSLLILITDIVTVKNDQKVSRFKKKLR